MKLRNLVAAKAAVIAVLAFLTGSATAEPVNLRYVERPLNDPEVAMMWADRLDEAGPVGQYQPWATVARVRFDGTRELTISQLWSGPDCGITDCPIRVFEDDRLLATFMACSEDGHHVVSDDARLLTACGNVHPTNRR
jgi:hypothetical protein